MHITDSKATSQDPNPLQLLRTAAGKLRTPRVNKALTEVKEFYEKVDKFIREYGDALRSQNQTRWGNTADCDIGVDLFGEEPVPVVLTPDQQVIYEQLMKERKSGNVELNVELREAFEEAFSYRRALFELCQKLKTTGEYKRFLDEHRQDPDSVEDPHPLNVRVIAAVSQHQAAVGNLYVKLISKLHERTDSMDDLIKQAEDTVLFAKPIPSNPGSTIDLQKPVSTPNREHKDAWKKSDNIDPLVRRIVIFIVGDNGSGPFSGEAEELKRHYVEKRAGEFDTTSNPKAYRVDKIITIKSPTLEDEEQGITLKAKIEDAFKKAELFAKQETETSGGQDLKFEGIAHWLGHGVCKGEEHSLPDIIDDKDFLEGSKDFRFITKWTSSEFKFLDAAAIKKLEREHLRAFRYFIQNVTSCHSGALTS